MQKKCKLPRFYLPQVITNAFFDTYLILYRKLYHVINYMYFLISTIFFAFFWNEDIEIIRFQQYIWRW